MNIAVSIAIPDDEEKQTELSFDELSDRAKEKARDNYRQNYPDDGWWDSSYEDFDKIADMMGICIATKQVPLMNGKNKSVPAIYFSGFWCQGDGACFEGNWYPEKDPLASLTKVMGHAPNDADLHEIAFGLAHLSERCNQLIPEARVKVEHNSRYYHSNSVSYDIDLPMPIHIQEGNELQHMVFDGLRTKLDLDDEAFETEVSDLLRRFMDWMYGLLEEEHEHLTSDEVIDQYLEEMKFDEDGEAIY
ncbi:hypothetical protein J2045_003365 [Peteryoungia aggregata LMG 23059]|uniref:Uncharacterized protein n=1 Tax=Peteryoungia aggregata LMG 23059 TaxID=1368425 RepID=A0ABU0GCH5_9HYPH|nr:hypothetical protein [Peteryoungia aggregata]MDQ0422317.1 hypothetical protein [Peteryoungia aggregata LMG 23059]